MTSHNPDSSPHPLMARAMFEDGYNCSQAVLCTFAEAYGLDETLALKLAAPYGGGMGRQGLQCGAVSGALMVIGLHGGRVDPNDEATRVKNDALVVAFMEEFREEFGALECNALTGIEMLDAEARTAAQEAGVFGEVCPGLVRRAAEILEELLEA